jgi:hypothetical protein
LPSYYQNKESRIIEEFDDDEFETGEEVFTDMENDGDTPGIALRTVK